MTPNPSTTPHFPIGSTLTYSFATANYSDRVTFSYKIDSGSLSFNYKEAVALAFSSWASVANISFREVADGADVDIRFGFQNIDGKGSVLGREWHTYSSNIILESDISFDVAENWTYTTFRSVALHEIGHSLGLDHEDAVPSVMATATSTYPTALSTEDIRKIQALYPANSGSSGGSSSGGSSPDGGGSSPGGGSSADPTNLIAIVSNGVRVEIQMAAYSGPVAGLVNQHIGTGAAEAMRGSSLADFINTLGGDDAIDGRAGNDVLDGGQGSNFLTGGSGTDTFFVDGRGGGSTWSTVTDLEKGEWITAWGWRAGVSKLTWEEMAGATDYKGATAHIDLDANGSIDISMTIVGVSSGAVLTTSSQVDGNGYLAFALT